MSTKTTFIRYAISFWNSRKAKKQKNKTKQTPNWDSPLPRFCWKLSQLLDAKIAELQGFFSSLVWLRILGELESLVVLNYVDTWTWRASLGSCFVVCVTDIYKCKLLVHLLAQFICFFAKMILVSKIAIFTVFVDFHRPKLFYDAAKFKLNLASEETWWHFDERFPVGNEALEMHKKWRN